MANTYQIIPSSSFKRMSWKNGLGETLEIVRAEDEQGVLFRISQASVVEDGIFSDFSGLQRTLVLLSGEGMTLSHSGESSGEDILKAPLDIARFYGGDQTFATLHGGTIEDLNIMVRRRSYATCVTPLNDACDFRFESSANSVFNAIYALDECAFLDVEKNEGVGISAGAILLLNHSSQNTNTSSIRWQKGRAVAIHIESI